MMRSIYAPRQHVTRSRHHGPASSRTLCISWASVNAMLPQIAAFLGTSHGPVEAWLVGIG